MLRTPLCDLLGIEIPVILAPMGSATSAEFAAAVSNHGGLGGNGDPDRVTERPDCPRLVAGFVEYNRATGPRAGPARRPPSLTRRNS